MAFGKGSLSLSRKAVAAFFASVRHKLKLSTEYIIVICQSPNRFFDTPSVYSGLPCMQRERLKAGV